MKSSPTPALPATSPTPTPVFHTLERRSRPAYRRLHPKSKPAGHLVQREILRESKGDSTVKVLVACEESQTVCKAFRERGHEAYSCDIQEPSGGHPEWHILGDALKAIEGGQIVTMDGKAHDIGKWDLLIAHPPCTYLSNAGARWLFAGHKLNQDRYAKGLGAKDFFMKFYNADIPHICVENSAPSAIYEMPKASQSIQPYQYYGKNHPYTKKTCLWLKELPLLIPVEEVAPTGPYCPCGTHAHKGDARFYGAAKRGEDAKNRAKTFPGIAAAMAEQWGSL